MEEASTARTAVRGHRLLMTAAIVVATAAGIVGAIMLVAPTSTGTYFAWALGPPGLAALVGGFYVVSAPVFGYAGTRPAVEVRGLAAAVLAFTVPTLVATYLHRDIFDFSRLMAVAWVVLFIASPITFALLLWSGRRAQPPPNDPRLNRAVRAVLGVLAIGFAGLAVSFWITTDGPVPFEVAPLGARFLAAWLAFFAVLGGWPALRPTLSEARVPLLSLVCPSSRTVSEDCSRLPSTQDSSVLEPSAISLPLSASSPSPASRLYAVTDRSNRPYVGRTPGGLCVIDSIGATRR